MARSCKECVHFSDCELPALAIATLIAYHGTDWQAMRDRMADTPPLDTGLDDFVNTWLDERMAEAEDDNEPIR